VLATYGAPLCCLKSRRQSLAVSGRVRKRLGRGSFDRKRPVDQVNGYRRVAGDSEENRISARGDGGEVC